MLKKSAAKRALKRSVTLKVLRDREVEVLVSGTAEGVTAKIPNVLTAGASAIHGDPRCMARRMR